MNLKSWLLALTVTGILAGPTFAQTTPPNKGTAGGACPTGDQAAQITDQLSNGSLAAILSDGNLARALGLDEEQFMEAQDILDAYQVMMQMSLMIDPNMDNPETMQSLMMMRLIMEFELYSILTPEQQQALETLFQQHQGSGQASQVVPQKGSTSSLGTVK